MSRYVVTGAAGFIGSHLAERLVQAGHHVKGIDRFSDYYPAELKVGNIAGLIDDPNFELVRRDLATDDLDQHLADCDGVFHLAAQPGVRGSWGDGFAAYLTDNVEATQRVFEACARHAIRVVFASSSSVYGDVDGYPTSEQARLSPVSPYGVTKLTCEALAHAYAASRQLDFVGLRYFTVFGPRQRPDMALTRILEAIAAGGVFEIFGSGQQSRDITYVGDAASATLMAMAHAPSGRIYNVGGGVEISLRDLIAVSERIAQRPLRLLQKPFAGGDVRRTSASTDLIGRDIGWRPEMTIEEGVSHQLAWILSSKEP